MLVKKCTFFIYQVIYKNVGYQPHLIFHLVCKILQIGYISFRIRQLWLSLKAQSSPKLKHLLLYQDENFLQCIKNICHCWRICFFLKIMIFFSAFLNALSIGFSIKIIVICSFIVCFSLSISMKILDTSHANTEESLCIQCVAVLTFSERHSVSIINNKYKLL